MSKVLPEQLVIGSLYEVRQKHFSNMTGWLEPCSNESLYKIYTKSQKIGSCFGIYIGSNICRKQETYYRFLMGGHGVHFIDPMFHEFHLTTP